MTKKEKRTLLTGLGLLGAGAGATTAANVVFPHSTQQEVEKLVDWGKNYDVNKYPLQEQLNNYLWHGSQSSAHKVFGIPIPEFMYQTREGPIFGHPWMLKAFPFLKDYRSQESYPRDDSFIYKHYNEFSKGPLAAYRQFIQERVNELKGSDTWEDVVKDAVTPTTQAETQRAIDRLPEKLQKFSPATVNKIFESRPNVLNEYLNDFLANRGITNESALTPTEQMSLLREYQNKFVQNLKPGDAAVGDAHNLLENFAGAHIKDYSQNYEWPFKNIKKYFHDVPTAAGYGLGAAGLGTLGYLAYKGLKNKAEARKNKKMSESFSTLGKKAADWLLKKAGIKDWLDKPENAHQKLIPILDELFSHHTTAGLLGAGAGGLTGYLATSKGGRNKKEKIRARQKSLKNALLGGFAGFGAGELGSNIFPAQSAALNEFLVKNLIRRPTGRIFTNVVEPFGYENSGKSLAELRKDFPSLLKAVIKDEPVWDIQKKHDPGYLEQLAARQPLMRDMFDLPLRGNVDAFTKIGPHRFKINPKTEAGKKMMEGFVNPDTIPHDYLTATGSRGVMPQPYHPDLGGFHETTLPGGGIKAQDLWDFGIDPWEGMGKSTNWVRYLINRMTKAPSYEANLTPAQVASRIGDWADTRSGFSSRQSTISDSPENFDPLYFKKI